MRAIFGSLVTVLILIVLACFTWATLRHTADSTQIHAAPIIEKAKQAATTEPGSHDAQPSASYVGPLPTYMSKLGPVAVEKVQAAEYKPPTSDHVGGSVA